MKVPEIFKKIGYYLLRFLRDNIIYIGAIIVGIITGCIWGTWVGVFTFFAIGLGFIFYIMLRQLYWWITKTGDYEKKSSNPKK
jgi:hypothetical protein